MQAEVMIEVTLSSPMTTLMVAPRAARIDADQKISPNSAGMYNRPPTRSPYLLWNGSSIVKYSLSRMIFAKKIPPGRKWEIPGKDALRNRIYYWK